MDLRNSSVRPTAVGEVQNEEVDFVKDLGDTGVFLDGRWVSDWLGMTCCLLQPLPNLQIPCADVRF